MQHEESSRAVCQKYKIVTLIRSHRILTETDFTTLKKELTLLIELTESFAAFLTLIKWAFSKQVNISFFDKKGLL